MSLQTNIGESWYNTLSPYFNSSEFEQLTQFINTEYKTKTIYPAKENVFKAFRLCPFNETRIIWIGQDPYPAGQALGLSFGVDPAKYRIPQSLQLIVEELENCTNDRILNLLFDYTLESWAKQGVLMLNTALTVEKNKIGSHIKVWESFTEEVFKVLCTNHTGLIFVLLGKESQKYKKFINQNQNIIEAPHPASEVYSGRRSGFLGSGLFNQIDELTMKINNNKIKWI